MILLKFSKKIFFPPTSFCILFLLHPIDNTLVVQYLLVQGCLKLRVHEKKKRMAKSTLS